MKFRILAISLILSGSNVSADEMKMAVTTSFHNSGLSDILLPKIQEDTGIDVQLLVVGTGQALRLGTSGDVDAILVHSRDAEDAFLADHHGTHRTEIMYNDFVMIGPRSDPTAISEHTDIKSIFTDIHETQSAFISRGDDSGTHQKEIALWTNAELDPETFAAWYREVGAGMGAALNTAVGLNAYILADRASWLNFANKGQLKLLFSGDPSLFNQYAYIPVSPEKHSQIKHDEALRLEAWLVSNTAKALIDSYEIDGEKLFTFNAK